MFGIDVSKDTLVCALMDPATRHLRWEVDAPNNPEGIDRLLAQTPEGVPWVMEPTGRYSLSVAIRARAAGRRVLLAQPKKAKKFLESIQSRAKTDRLDCRGIALYALSVALAEYPVNSSNNEKMKQLLAARKGISKSVSSLQQRATELPLVAGTLKQAVADLRTQLKSLDRQIAAERRHFPTMQMLEKVPGIGPVTAAAMANCLSSKDFATPDQFVAYVGLDIAVRNSGRRKGNRGLTKQGDAELRRLLYLCALSSLRAKSSPFAAQYGRERKKGLTTTAALCAVARKMARLCWSLVRHQSEYDPERVYSQN